MPLVRVRELRKDYRVRITEPGLGGALRALVRPTFRVVEALKGVSFDLDAGEIVALIGPNGAGKSTAIKLLSGILTPTSGECDVGGLIPWSDRVRHVSRIGVVFGQKSQLWWDLPVKDGFDLLGAIFRVPPGDFRRRLDHLTGALALEGLLETQVRQLSLGQRMRCELGAALLHGPELLFLDEPTIGLDAPSKLAVREIIRTLNRESGVTVILTTHDMHDVEAVAERVMVVADGRILSDGPFQDLKAEVAPEARLLVTFNTPPGPLTWPDAAVEQPEPGRAEIRFDPSIVAAHTLISRIAGAFDVSDIRVDEPSIEEVIARFYALHGAGEG